MTVSMIGIKSGDFKKAIESFNEDTIERALALLGCNDSKYMLAELMGVGEFLSFQREMLYFENALGALMVSVLKADVETAIKSRDLLLTFMEKTKELAEGLTNTAIENRKKEAEKAN